MGNSHSLGAVYAGRFVAGLGVGQTVVVGPVYLAEIVRTSLSLLSRTIGHKLTVPVTSVDTWSVYLYVHWLRVPGHRPGLFCQLRLRSEHERPHSQAMGKNRSYHLPWNHILI